MYPYGLIGNCQTSALVHECGSIDWLCFPRPDSPPVFGKILDPDGGHFSITPMGKFSTQQQYLQNTNVLETYVTTEDGAQFKIVDFCPRFYQHGRIYRPMMIFRVVEPIKGNPQIRVECNPVNGWEKEFVKPVRGNSHLRFEIRNDALRLWTNMPLTYLCENTAFMLKDKIHFALTWSAGMEDDLEDVCERFRRQTVEYWDVWVKHCSIPTLYQQDTIRSALALKLHCYEDTGAVLAALTTSLPEERGHERNWDYRFCWLRDAYFSLSAFHNLGHFEETEGFIKFLLNVAEKHEHSVERLRPVYRLDQTLPDQEIEHLNWAGYANSKPVRSDNQAAEHIQNDVYGEMVLTLSPIFFDERFLHLRTPDHERLLEHLGRFCASKISEADAGLWELRHGWQEHSFSNLMCWAGLERIHRIRRGGRYLKQLTFNLEEALQKAEHAVREAVIDGSLRNGPKDPTHDASLLQVPILRFPDDEVCRMTVEHVREELRMGETPDLASFLYRYRRKDDFGRPHSSFLICSFWLVQALARVGKFNDAKIVMRDAMSSANYAGLLSEHYLPGSRLQAGNFPQAYSHVGQINAAFAISPPWSDVL